MKMRRSSAFLILLKLMCLGLVAIGVLWSGSSTRAQDAFLHCENDYIPPLININFPEYPQVLNTEITVLTDPDTPPSSHSVSVLDTDHNRLVAVYYFTVNPDGTVHGSGPGAQTSQSHYCPIANGIYYSTVIAVNSFNGDNFPFAAANIGDQFPPVLNHRQFILDLAFGVTPTPDQIKSQTIQSDYSYKYFALTHYGIFSFLGQEGPFTPGASASPSTDEEIQYQLPGALAQAKNQPFPCAGGCSSCRGGGGAPAQHMAVASLDRFQAGIAITDTPISYSPAVGRNMAFTVNYHQRLANQPATFNYSNLGPLWQFNWIAYIKGGPSNGQNQATYYAPDGSQYTYQGYEQQVSSGQGDFQDNEGWTHATLHYRQNPERYERWLPDGTVEFYSQQAGTSTTNRLFFLTVIIDPQGYTTTLNYDPNAAANGQALLTSIVDPVGNKLVFAYGTSNPLQIVKVTRSNDGLSARFQYDPSTHQLTSITDPIGITSSFHYTTVGANANFINTMTTPYGQTTFSSSDGSGYLEADMTNPLSQTERVEYQESLSTSIIADTDTAPTVSGVTFDNTNLNHANTFYWSRRAMADAATAGDNDTTNPAAFYAMAEVTHWAQGGLGSVPVPSSTKKRLEGRVWYGYPVQQAVGYVDTVSSGSSTQPALTARVVDGVSGTETQLYQAAYNANGLILQSIDPLNRETDYFYDANNIDLLQVQQKNGGSYDVLSTMTYNSLHQPLTITDASGRTTTLAYYSTTDASNKQLHTRTNAKGEVTTMAYDGTTGYMTSVTGAIAGATTSYTYDSAGRVHTVADSESYTVTTAYDNLDRPTTVTYPDSTTDQTTYNKLDVVKTTDRQGRSTTNTYDAIRELLSTTDPLGRTTKYSWCTCGGLSTLTDANNHITAWGLDGQGRVTAKTYDSDLSGTTNSSTISYAYQTNTSRLSTMTDAIGNVSTYTYNKDNNLHSTSCTLSGTPTAPTVTFTYDSVYNRVTDMADGTANGSYPTTHYAYNAPSTGTAITGGNQLHTITIPIVGTSSASTVTYSYDELGRVTGRTIDSGNSVSTSFDALGRVTNITNALGAFTYAYADTPEPSNRLATITYPSGTGLTANYSYFDSTHPQDFERLQEIQNKHSSTNVSKFDYTYKPVGTIATWTTTADSSSAITNTVSYDAADQVTSNIQTGGGSNTNSYAYDPAGNRLAETANGTTTGGQFNNLNQLTAIGGTTPTTVSGHVSAAVTNVTVNDVSASLSGTPQTNYTANVPLPVGTNIVSVVAQDSSGDVNTQKFEGGGLTLSGTVPTALTYDLNGNCTQDEAGNTYTWDGLNRLVSIAYHSGAHSGTHTEFAYDGLSRRVSVIEKSGTTYGAGTPSNTKLYIWVGSEIAEERDSSGSLATNGKRFFSQGEQQIVSGTAALYYYFQDHLGSVREVLNGSGTTLTRYGYDPYGKPAAPVYLSGSTDATFRYTGDYYHVTSGLNLTKYRAYDSNTGRWLSRDPLQNADRSQGPNLYTYVQNNAVNGIDLTGLHCNSWFEDYRGGPEPIPGEQVTLIAYTDWAFFTIIVVPDPPVAIKLYRRYDKWRHVGATKYLVYYHRLCYCDSDPSYQWFDHKTDYVTVPYDNIVTTTEWKAEPVDGPDDDVHYPKTEPSPKSKPFPGPRMPWPIEP